MTLKAVPLGEVWSREVEGPFRGTFPPFNLSEGLGFDCKVAQHEMLVDVFTAPKEKKGSGAARRVPEGSGGTGRFRVEEVSEGSWVPDVFSLKLLVFLGPKNVPAKGLGEAGMPAGGFERVWKVLQGWWRCLKA